MATTYGSFPGVQVTTAGGGITSVALGAEEKVVLFGRASYQNDGTFLADGEPDPTDGSASVNTPVQINARREADEEFGDGSELADEMRASLANEASIEFLYGVAPTRYNGVETSSQATGTLANAPIWEDNVSDEDDIENIDVEDDGSSLTVVFTYVSSPSAPQDADTIKINPLTGEFVADGVTNELTIKYKYLDWETAVTAGDVHRIVNEDETGVYGIVTDSDEVSTPVQTEVEDLRDSYSMVNVLSGAEPNDEEVVTDEGEPFDPTDYSNYQRTDAQYDTSDYANANQSIDEDYYFKIAPSRIEDEKRRIIGGVAGLFAGNPVADPIYNDQVEGYSGVEQKLTKTEADELRDENVIPIRQAASIRVKDNLSTSTEEDWERDFWRRRIADRVILVGKTVGDAIIGQINDESTRNAAERMIRQEMRNLVEEGLIRPNAGGDESWYVDVYADSDNPNQVNIDMAFTPYGIVKRVEETITINT